MPTMVAVLPVTCQTLAIQLHRLLEAGHARGHLLVEPKNGKHIHLSPQLFAAFVGWTASELGNYRL